MRSGITRGILKGSKSSRKTFDILGFTVSDLKSHLERQFHGGMSWDNYGMFGWHIDHRLPLAAFDYHSLDCSGFRRAWALSNLQPMWAAENWSKNDRVISAAA